jgi:hypothetical protein
MCHKSRVSDLPQMMDNFIHNICITNQQLPETYRVEGLSLIMNQKNALKYLF